MGSGGRRCGHRMRPQASVNCWGRGYQLFRPGEGGYCDKIYWLATKMEEIKCGGVAPLLSSAFRHLVHARTAVVVCYHRPLEDD
jgi:hypothetical protein